jgi:thiamine-monophosphate kinase
VLTRRGARPGDEIYVSGSVGAAAAGLEMLKTSPAPADNPCTGRYLYPDPRVRLGLMLGRGRAATACVDLSDGLADGIGRLAEASGVGAAIDAAAVPIEPDAARWFDGRVDDPVVCAMTGGDDYELLFTVRPRLRGRLSAATQHGKVAITRIGVCTSERGVVLRRAASVESPIPGGYSHFR